MPKAPIEIAVLGEVSAHEVEMAISIANSEQDEFAFSRLFSPFEKELNLNTRATRALLSPLAAMGLVERDEGVWKNSAVADKYLVQGNASYMGTYFA